MDVTQSESLKQPFKEAADFKGRLDGLVAAAGIQYEAPALDYTAEDYRRILDVNVPLLILCDTGALRRMESNGRLRVYF